MKSKRLEKQRQKLPYEAEIMLTVVLKFKVDLSALITIYQD
jgi:hypothetical protein